MTQRNMTISLVQSVYNELLSDLAANRRQAGDRLVEAVIARQREVSRTPVREALGRLENDGLIESVPPNGYVIITPTIEDIREIFAIRRALEPLAFSGLIEVASANDDTELRSLLSNVQAAHTPEDAATANIFFRNFWMSRIQNRRLKETLSRFHMQVHLVRAATLKLSSGRETARIGAGKLAESYWARDTDAAQDAMTQFVDAALATFEAVAAEKEMAQEPLPKLTG
ncbi:GntR family transcriptional regulator [Falsihalocynthiibacter arcticus]|nr:GntR family transcriptional regulator [Falsihalocynthiibacter arcticus]